MAINYALPGKLTSLSYNLNFKICKLTKEEREREEACIGL